MEDIQALLQAAFADELAEHLAGMRAALAGHGAGEAVDLREFFRRAHSLKGAARAVEQPETERLAHALETVLDAIAQGTRALDAETAPLLRAQIDAIEDAAARGGQAAPADGAAGAERDESVPAPEAAAPGGEGPGGEGVVRVSAQAVERLTRSLHGLAAETQGQAALTNALAAVEADLAALAAVLDRGDMAEARRQVARARAAAGRLRRAQGRSAWGIDRALAALEDDTEQVLMVPTQMLFDGHDRMVRELAQRQGKAAILRIEGAETAADRRVLQALRDPVLHMLRNAVGHGIETAAGRRAAGKPEQGVVRVTARAVRGRFVVTVADDGAGLDAQAIERRARAAGLIAADAPAPPAAALHALLFEQGFSTAAAVDELSGRGVGLSVVADAARRLQGGVTIAPAGDAGGTVVTLDVPLSIARQTMLLVACGGATHAVPAAAVLRVARIAHADIITGSDGQTAVIDGAVVPVAALSAVLGVATAGTPDDAGTLPLLWMRSGVALVVDALLAVRSLVVGDPGAIAVAAPLVAGTVLLDDGAVALVLEPDRLAAQARGGGRAIAVAAAPAPVRQRTILVVDDSITTRTLERGILEAAGYAVRLAVDGLAGLERLRDAPGEIDLVVADVEMPRMDGFGLLAAVRNDPALSGIPVVMMTSRDSPDDIERGLALGASAYVTKQLFDQGGLLSVIGQLI